MRLRISIANTDSLQTQIFLSGEVDLENVSELRATLEGVAQGEAKQVVLDLSELSYLGSVGVSVIIKTLDELDANGGQLAITGAHGSVRVVLEMLGLYHLVRQEDSKHVRKSSAASGTADGAKGR